MRKFSKSIMISSFLIVTTNHLEASTCPTLNRDHIRTLCRWDALKSIPLLNIEAKKMTVDGVILQNKHDTCREADSIKQFLTKNATIKYEGRASKDFKAPNDHTQVLCLYHIDKEVYGFSAEGVPHPDAHAKKENVEPKVEPTTPPKKHVVKGWAYGEGPTVDKGMKEVEIKSSHQTIEKANKPEPTQHPIPDQQTGPNPLSGKRMRAVPPSESPPPRPARELPTRSGGTPPPDRLPPPVPSRAPQKPVPDLPNKRQAVQYEAPPLGD